MIAPQKFVGGYPAFSFQLDFVEHESSVLRSKRKQTAGGLIRDVRAKDFEFSFVTSFVAQNRESAWPGIERADLPLDQLSGFVPIDPAVFAREFRRVSRDCRILRNARRCCARKLSERIAQSRRPDLRQSIVKRSAGFIGRDLDSLLQ